MNRSATTAAAGPTVVTARGCSSLRRFRPCCNSSTAPWRGRRRNRRGSQQMREHRSRPDVLPGRERLRGHAAPGQHLLAYRNQLDLDRHDAHLREREPGVQIGQLPDGRERRAFAADPCQQEKLLTHEIGGKFGLFDGRLQLNAATFYYDYTDKQILCAINDLVFGSLPALVNVPDSHVVGWEASITWKPIDSLVFSPSPASRSRTRRNGSRT
jgi:TonB dependent receptor